MATTFDGLFSVKGKTALVTGGSRGIGEMIAAGFLDHGAKVYISSRKAEACEETAARLSEMYNAECVPLPGDLSLVSEAERLAAALGEKEEKLDILVNNAGAAWGADFDSFPEVGWDKVMDTNVKGIFFLTQKLLPLMKAAGSADDPARVINVGSIDGLRTPAMNNFSYSPAKAAVHYMTKVLGSKLIRDHIAMNAIAPGPFPTWMLSTGIGAGGDTENVDWDAIGKMSPSGRVGAAEDVVGTALFLASKASSYVIGQTIALDGGIVAAS